MYAKYESKREPVLSAARRGKEEDLLSRGRGRFGIRANHGTSEAEENGRLKATEGKEREILFIII